jgi:hypothetical protein
MKVKHYLFGVRLPPKIRWTWPFVTSDCYLKQRGDKLISCYTRSFCGFTYYREEVEI